MEKITRRDLLVTAPVTLAALSLTTCPTYAQTIPNLETLKGIVRSQRDRTRVFVNIDFLKFALLSIIFDRNNKITSYDSFSSVKGGENWSEDFVKLNNWLDNFYSGKFNNEILAKLRKDDAQSLLDASLRRSENFLSNLNVILEEGKILPSGGRGQEALNAVVIVEQVATVLTDDPNTATPFLCGFFPFRYFCR